MMITALLVRMALRKELQQILGDRIVDLDEILDNSVCCL